VIIHGEHLSGEVATATVVMDRDIGRSRGFGFVEISDDNAALQAIQAVNGKEVDGRESNVNEARRRGSSSSISRPDKRSGWRWIRRRGLATGTAETDLRDSAELTAR